MYNIYVNDDQRGSGSPIFKHADLDSELFTFLHCSLTSLGRLLPW